MTVHACAMEDRMGDAALADEFTLVLTFELAWTTPDLAR